jgi:uncharacterized protein YkuJ
MKELIALSIAIIISETPPSPLFSQENVKPTIKHIVESHGEQLREVEYVSTFKEFCLRYEQNEDTSMLDPLAYVW